VERLGRDVGAALDDIRSVAHAADASPILRLGIPASVRALAANSPVPATVELNAPRRYSPDVERNVYYCIAEGFQNALKHGGASAAVRVGLVERRNHLVFEVEDSGRGFDPAHTPTGDGLSNISDRVAALGGQLTVESRPGAGTLIRGVVPVAAR
jgi:signal transduction histidine kinase